MKFVNGLFLFLPSMSSHEPTNGELFEAVQGTNVRIDGVLETQRDILEVVNQHTQILKQHSEMLKELGNHAHRTDVKFDILHRTIDEKVEDVLAATNVFSNETERRFDLIDQRFNQLEQRVGHSESTRTSPASKRW